jgi:hypothetical protein
MKRISLTQGKIALVSDRDYPRVRRIRWHANRSGKVWYARSAQRRIAGKPRPFLRLHRFILGVTDPTVRIDHKNLNGLDCRRSNMRLATHSQNMHNQARHRDNRSGFKGVYYYRRGRIWRAQITVNRHLIYLGQFASAHAAARAYDAAAIKYHGEFARPNDA